MKKLFILLAVTAVAFLKCSQQPEVIKDLNLYNKHVQSNPDMELVDLKKHIPDAVFDVRYATENNFTGEIIYDSPIAFARLPVAEALIEVQDSLKKVGLTLVFFDAYRPYSATVKFYEVYPDKRFVAHPKDGSRHNRGCAVDISLADASDGTYLEMPTEFDDFTDRASPDYPDLPEHVKENRDFLIDIMSDHGFSVYPNEWWHFDFNGWEKYPLMDIIPE